MAAIRPRDLGAILSIWAHPDDETYLAGGVMATAAATTLPDTAWRHKTQPSTEWPITGRPATSEPALDDIGASLRNSPRSGGEGAW